MKIQLIDGLPFVEATLIKNGRQIHFQKVLLDTGSGGTIFRADLLQTAGISPDEDAAIRRIVGVGGVEFVVEVGVDQLSVGSVELERFVIETGTMDYGFDFDGIIGFDFLRQVGAVLDFEQMEIR